LPIDDAEELLEKLEKNAQEMNEVLDAQKGTPEYSMTED
jgi:hypothetical protein